MAIRKTAKTPKAAPKAKSPSPKMNPASDQASTSASTSGPEDLIIEGKAQDAAKDAGQDTVSPKPETKNTESKNTATPQRRNLLAAFALLIALLATGLGGWAALMAHQNKAPDAYQGLTTRIDRLDAEQAATASRRDLDAITAEVKRLSQHITTIRDDVISMINALPQPSENLAAGDAAQIEALQSQITVLQDRLTAIADAQDAAAASPKTQKAKTTEAETPEAETSEAETQDNDPWWQTLWGAIRISRIAPDNEGSQ